MSTQHPHHNFMQKKGGPVVRVPKNEWAKYRRMGYDFSTEEAWNEQRQNETPEPEVTETPDLPTDANTKAEILDFAEANNIDVDANDTKADLLAQIAEAFA